MRFVRRFDILRIKSHNSASEDQLEKAKDPVSDQKGERIAG